MTGEQITAEVIVVGGGAAGMTAALVLGRQQRSTLVIDSADYRNAPSEAINMLAASNHISPQDYLQRGHEALAELDTVMRMRGHVTSAEEVEVNDPDLPGNRQGVRLTLANGQTLVAHRLILATGQHDRVNAIAGASELWGTRVLHCPYCHGWESRGKNVLVVAVPDESNPMWWMAASYQALYIRDRLSSEVSIALDHDTLPEEFLDAFAQRGITVYRQGVRRLRESGEGVSIELADGEVLTREAVFMTPPTSPGSDLAAQLGLDMHGSTILVDEHQRTSHPAVFAAGDGCVQRGNPMPMPFVAQAQAHGQLAGIWVDQDLFFAHPHTPAFPQG